MLLRADDFLGDHVEHGNQAYAENRRDEHPGKDRHAYHLARLGASARRRQQRHDTENERERGHQNRPEAELGGIERRVHQRLPRVELHLRELDDENRRSSRRDRSA